MSDMIWCLISMVLGALVFGAGIVFEKLSSAEPEPENEIEEPAEKVNPALLRQWENLLGYDGTEQEETENENI